MSVNDVGMSGNEIREQIILRMRRCCSQVDGRSVTLRRLKLIYEMVNDDQPTIPFHQLEQSSLVALLDSLGFIRLINDIGLEHFAFPQQWTSSMSTSVSSSSSDSSSDGCSGGTMKYDIPNNNVDCNSKIDDSSSEMGINDSGKKNGNFDCIDNDNSRGNGDLDNDSIIGGEINGFGNGNGNGDDTCNIGISNNIASNNEQDHTSALTREGGNVKSNKREGELHSSEEAVDRSNSDIHHGQEISSGVIRNGMNNGHDISGDDVSDGSGDSSSEDDIGRDINGNGSGNAQDQSTIVEANQIRDKTSTSTEHSLPSTTSTIVSSSIVNTRTSYTNSTQTHYIPCDDDASMEEDVDINGGEFHGVVKDNKETDPSVCNAEVSNKEVQKGKWSLAPSCRGRGRSSGRGVDYEPQPSLLTNMSVGHGRMTHFASSAIPGMWTQHLSLYQSPLGAAFYEIMSVRGHCQLGEYGRQMIMMMRQREQIGGRGIYSLKRDPPVPGGDRRAFPNTASDGDNEQSIAKATSSVESSSETALVSVPSDEIPACTKQYQSQYPDRTQAPGNDESSAETASSYSPGLACFGSRDVAESQMLKRLVTIIGHHPYGIDAATVESKHNCQCCEPLPPDWKQRLLAARGDAVVEWKSPASGEVQLFTHGHFISHSVWMR